MFESALVILTVLYAIVSVKVEEWITISALGFKGATPMMFLQNPIFYKVVRGVFFLGAVASCFGLVAVPWYVGLLVLAVVWLAAGALGRKKAFAKYRQILQEMMASAESSEERAKYESESQKSNQELMDKVKFSMKYGI
ncbi:MAG: hypothetical protein GXX85_10020 [Ignavibacteria bacterium]|nr:hypothetical protein [Ignavibacteria bacterium]